MKKFVIAEDLEIEALGKGEVERPQVILREVDDDPYAETQSIIVYASEIKAVVSALVEAGVWLANQE